MLNFIEILKGKYREFYKLVHSQPNEFESKFDSLKKAGTLLVQLLEAPKLVPYKYKRIILYDLRALVSEVTL
jgi:hypothetical protein